MHVLCHPVSSARHQTRRPTPIPSVNRPLTRPLAVQPSPSRPPRTCCCLARSRWVPGGISTCSPSCAVCCGATVAPYGAPHCSVCDVVLAGISPHPGRTCTVAATPSSTCTCVHCVAMHGPASVGTVPLNCRGVACRVRHASEDGVVALALFASLSTHLMHRLSGLIFYQAAQSITTYMQAQGMSVDPQIVARLGLIVQVHAVVSAVRPWCQCVSYPYELWFASPLGTDDDSKGHEACSIAGGRRTLEVHRRFRRLAAAQPCQAAHSVRTLPGYHGPQGCVCALRLSPRSPR